MTDSQDYWFKKLGRSLSNWQRWGEGDELGTLNFLTSERRIAAAELVRTGELFDLGMIYSTTGPQRFGSNASRFDPIHMMTALPTESTRPAGIAFADDVVVMPLQCGTQWDSLAHAGYDGYLYNGVPMTDITADGGARRNSIDKVATRILGRGVLLDIARLRKTDRLEPGSPITADDLETAANSQHVTIQSGDILLVRSGWYQHILAGDFASYMQLEVPGLDISCCSWLREKEISAVGSDTYCVEVKPSGQPGVTHPVHMVLIRDLGMTLGEMFNLEGLAAHCAMDDQWEFFFSGIPLKLANCVGSPVSPIAIK